MVAHAGLPAPSAEAFLAFLAYGMRRDGVRSAEDLLATWRTERTALAVLPAPARRFLLYGGRPAEDLLSRCIEAIADVSRLGRAPTAAESGLPAHVADALAAMPQAELGKPLRAPTGIARPTVELDPFDNLGVVAVLPAVSTQKLGSRWRIWDGEQDREMAASSVSASRIRLRPAPAWSIEFIDNAGLSRTWTFEGLERTGALVINPQSGVLSRTPTVIEDDQAWILYPSTWSLRADEGGLAELVEMPSLPGSWSSYSVVHADLTDVTELRLSSLIDPTSGAKIRVFPGAQRPSLVGEAVAGVRTEQGDPVFSCAPVVQVPRLEGVPDDRWRFQLRRNDGAPTTFIDPDGVHEGTVDLARRVGVESGLFRLSVRGPLGTDIATTFAVVPELNVDRPTTTIFPDDERPTVIVTAGSGIALEDGGAGEPVRLGVPVGVRSLAFRAGSATRQLDLRIDLPSLVWTLVHETKPAAAAGVERLRVGAEEFDDELADALVVRVGRPDVALGLSVRDGRELLADELSAQSAGPDGRWAFDLAPLAPTIRQHADLAPSIWLRVGSRELCVADVIPQLVLTKLQAQSRVVDDFSHVHVSFEQERRPRHRVVRLWSLDRPWDPPISAPVADDATSAQLSGWDVIPAGRYIVQVTVDDGWGVARRPASGARHTAPIWVGDKDQVTERLSRLDPAAPLQALELIANGRSVACELDDPEAHDVATAAAWCLLQDIEDLDPDDGPNHRFRRWAQYVLAEPATAVRALVDVVAEDAFADDVVLRAQLALVVQLDDVCVSEDDVLRRAWRSLPILAATVDRGDDADARSRRERYLFAGPQTPISPGAGRVDQRMAGCAVTELRQMRRMLALVPDAALDNASVQLACFEWLAVEIDDEREPQAPTPSAWLDRFGHLVEQLPADLPDAIRAHIDGRARAQGTIWWADFTQAVLAAGLHLVLPDGNRGGAAMALNNAVSFAPRLVTHDVLLATTLAAHGGTGGACMLNPLVASDRIREEYRRYLLSTFPLRRDDLRQELDAQLGGQFALSKGPYLQVSPPFVTGASVRELVEEDVLSRLWLDLPASAFPIDRPLYVHQEQAIRKAKTDRRNLVVTTGTGSGKTECFLIPIIDDLLREVENGSIARPGVRALLLYPMNALANDQLKRLRTLLAHLPKITFGRYVGDTQADSDLAEADFQQRYPYEPRLDNELISREAMQAAPPRILLTNYAMLEYLLLRPADSALFDGRTAGRWRHLVLDEVHVYDGTQGAEVAMLLRRLRDRVNGSQRGALQCFGTSATLGGGQHDYPKLVRYAEDLFDEPFAWNDGDPSQQDVVGAQHKPLVRGAGSWRLDPQAWRRIRAAYRDGASADDLHLASGDGVAEPTAGQTPEAWLADLLTEDEQVIALQRRLERGATTLRQAAQDIIGSGHDAEQTLVDLVDLGVAARHGADDAAVIPARYHFFLRALEGAFICLHPQHDSGPRLLLSRHEQCPSCTANGRRARMIELGSCRRCGAEYAIGVLKGLANGAFQLEPSRPSEVTGARLLLGEPLADDADDEDEATFGEDAGDRAVPGLSVPGLRHRDRRRAGEGVWLFRPAATRAGGDRPQQARAVGDPALPGVRAPLKRRHRRALHDGLRRTRSGDRHRPLPGDPRLDRRVLGPRCRSRPQAADVLRQPPGRGVLRALPGTDLQPCGAAAPDSDQRRTARRGRAVP